MPPGAITNRSAFTSARRSQATFHKMGPVAHCNRPRVIITEDVR